jgi:hypothetical protein
MVGTIIARRSARVNTPKMPRGRKVNACRNPVPTHHRMAWRQSLVWRFASPHHSCSECEMRHF